MPPPKLPGARVLIGCASAQEAAYLDQLLSSWGHTVEVAHEGYAILRRLQSEDPPEIALMDEDLPQMGGIEVVQEIRLRPSKRMIWTMVMCPAPSCDRVLNATDAGVDEFLAKPLDELDLRIRLHTAKRVRELRARLHQSVEDARFHASHDHLTGLWSREAMLRLLFQETDRVQRTRSSLSLVLLDLDHFSYVNLDCGYAGGDRVLVALADRLRRYLRSYDLIARCGEDEFLIALPGCRLEEAVQQAERTRQMLRRPFDVPGGEVSLTASFGVAPSRGRSPLVVLREAERALADAKIQGRDRVCASAAASAPVQPEASAAQAPPIARVIASLVPPSESPSGKPCRMPSTPRLADGAQ